MQIILTASLFIKVFKVTVSYLLQIHLFQVQFEQQLINRQKKRLKVNGMFRLSRDGISERSLKIFKLRNP